MLFSFVYLVFISVLKLLVGRGRPAQVKDIELIVLRHQNDVLRRQVERRTLRSSDRAFLAAASRLLLPQAPPGSARDAAGASSSRRPSCIAPKIQDLVTPASAHTMVMQRVLTEYDIGSRDALRRVRGLLRAAAQLDGLDAGLSAAEGADGVAERQEQHDRR